MMRLRTCCIWIGVGLLLAVNAGATAAKDAGDASNGAVVVLDDVTAAMAAPENSKLPQDLFPHPPAVWTRPRPAGHGRGGGRPGAWVYLGAPVPEAGLSGPATPGPAVRYRLKQLTGEEAATARPRLQKLNRSPFYGRFMGTPGPASGGQGGTVGRYARYTRAIGVKGGRLARLPDAAPLPAAPGAARAAGVALWPPELAGQQLRTLWVECVIPVDVQGYPLAGPLRTARPVALATQSDLYLFEEVAAGAADAVAAEHAVVGPCRGLRGYDAWQELYSLPVEVEPSADPVAAALAGPPYLGPDGAISWEAPPGPAVSLAPDLVGAMTDRLGDQGPMAHATPPSVDDGHARPWAGDASLEEACPAGPLFGSPVRIPQNAPEAFLSRLEEEFLGAVADTFEDRLGAHQDLKQEPPEHSVLLATHREPTKVIPRGLFDAQIYEIASYTVQWKPGDGVASISVQGSVLLAYIAGGYNPASDASLAKYQGAVLRAVKDAMAAANSNVRKDSTMASWQCRWNGRGWAVERTPR